MALDDYTYIDPDLVGAIFLWKWAPVEVCHVIYNYSND